MFRPFLCESLGPRNVPLEPCLLLHVVFGQHLYAATRRAAQRPRIVPFLDDHWVGFGAVVKTSTKKRECHSFCLMQDVEATAYWGFRFSSSTVMVAVASLKLHLATSLIRALLRMEWLAAHAQA